MEKEPEPLPTATATADETAIRREKFKHAVVGFVSTFLLTITTKIITMVAESDSVEHAINYVINNYPSLATAITAALAGGYFAQKWTKPPC